MVFSNFIVVMITQIGYEEKKQRKRNANLQSKPDDEEKTEDIKGYNRWISRSIFEIIITIKLNTIVPNTIVHAYNFNHGLCLA